MVLSGPHPGFAAVLIIICMIHGLLGMALNDDSMDPLDVQLETYSNEEPRVLPKRAALLLDKLLVALQKAVDKDEIGKEGSKSYARMQSDFPDFPESQKFLLADDKTMDLQRRGQAKGRVYWRCYFNAVTCFKKK
ncbi:uncharacterized protein LOC106655734 [Trichogramma pretiosum]|uniref:uncharacterized protein LOC106655734 n=1 Tax=Trichogramma pretiosum TaxID=7493 RepID=UPI0006C9855B|nr:uncharacterized protein LOC106655734 [Trichogramma pretiosum]